MMKVAIVSARRCGTIEVAMPARTSEPNSILATFDAVAEGYDAPARRFFSAAAAHMVARLGLRGDEHVLDLACGTGQVTIALARALPGGRVTAVDFSPRMLAQARTKAAAAGLTNIDLVERDMQALDETATFDVLTCGFGIFFVEDMDAQIRRMAAALKPGGRLMTSNFAEDYMQPMRSLMVARLARFGVAPPPQTWLRIAGPAGCRDLFASAGLREVAVERRELGYFLAGGEDWWDVIWNAGFRRLVDGLSPADQQAFKRQHLTEVEALRTPAGIRMDIGVLFTSGVAPGS
jgi:ubiquinone/menaquinone biosynthesis C-methylase UbiE